MIGFIKLTVYDQEGEAFIVPAELIESKFEQHQFAVHKSLSTGDNLWVVSHVESGGSIATAGTKANAIHAAQSRLKEATNAKLTKGMQKFQARRDQVLATKA